MSKVRMHIDVQIEFNADLSKIKNDTERAVAILLFAHCQESDGYFYVTEEDMSEIAEKYDIDMDELDFALNRLERKNFIECNNNIISLKYSHKRAKENTKIFLGKFDSTMKG